MRDFFFISTTLSKAKLTAALAPMFGFLTIDWLTGNVALGVAISAIMTAITAVVVSRPKLIAARTAALVTTTAAQDEHMAKIIHHLSELHEREVGYWKEKSLRQEKIEILMRATKHRALSCYQSATLAIQELHDLLRANHLPYPPFRFEHIHQITGDEDQEMIALIFPKETKDFGTPPPMTS